MVKTRYILFFVLLFVLAASCYTFAKSTPPSLGEVLRKQGASFDWSAIIFGFFAFSLTTLSLVKAYEIFSKSSSPKEESASNFKDAEIESLKVKQKELLDIAQHKREENESLRNQIFQLQEAIKDRANNEELLKKSLAGLHKECERLSQEKEKLGLELSRANSRNLFASSPSENKPPVARAVVKKKNTSKKRNSPRGRKK